ncbi:tetratricopeptide repeat protein, partial [Sulfitobacter sp. HI0129]
RLQPDHPETRMLLAELHVAAEDFPQARRSLGDLVESEPTARSVTLMAAIERGEGASDSVVKGWLTRALTVPRGPQWICENCQHIHASWQPVCNNCGSFDTLEWKTPPMSEVAMPGGVQMLPLIVGTTEDRAGARGVPTVATRSDIEEAELVSDDSAESTAANRPETSTRQDTITAGP